LFTTSYLWKKDFIFKCAIIDLFSIEVYYITTFYRFNAIANQLTEEELERKETSTVSIHWCFFEALFISLLLLVGTYYGEAEYYFK